MEQFSKFPNKETFDHCIRIGDKIAMRQQYVVHRQHWMTSGLKKKKNTVWWFKCGNILHAFQYFMLKRPKIFGFFFSILIILSIQM